MLPMWLFIRQDGTLRTPLKSHSGEKSEPMQLMGLQVSRGIIWNTHWRNPKQMQSVKVFILMGKQFKGTFENTQQKKLCICTQCNYSSPEEGRLMTQNESRIWKHSGESQTNATSVTLHLVRQVIWGYIWRHTVEKTQTYATSVTLRPLM